MSNASVTKNHLDAMEARILGSIQGINANFNESQGLQNEKIETIAEDVSKIKLVVLDFMGTDRHIHNLVHELKDKGIALDEKKIFAV